MIIFVVNAGSTSFKCRLYDMTDERELARAAVERIGGADALLSYTRGGKPLIVKERREIRTHADAVEAVTRLLRSPAQGVIGELGEIDGVGFKTVQAGDKNGTVPLTDDVLEAMERYAPLAPAHNPPYLACIRYFQTHLPGTPLVGVFEPGFHKEIPEYARIFGAPYEWYADHGVAKYGYHGATFRYVTARLRELGIAGNRLIACHLGGSSSICAIQDGRSIDVSMTFTPQSGVVQSGRTGDIDPYVLPYIMERTGTSLDGALRALSSSGGLKGISGIASGDMRDIQNAAATGDRRARLAIDKFVYDVVRYVGSFHVLLGGVDVIAFSGGIGFNNGAIRKRIIDAIAFLGVDLDPKADESAAEGLRTRPGSPIAVVTIDTNEEIVVARETLQVLENQFSHI